MPFDFEDHQRRRFAKQQSDDAQDAAREKRFLDTIQQLQNSAEGYAATNKVEYRKTEHGFRMTRGGETLQVTAKKDSTFEVLENNGVEDDKANTSRMMDLVVRWFEKA
jgi:hypothetical protein